jgi:hypothetical protein
MFPEAIESGSSASMDKGLCYMFPEARVDWQLSKVFIKDCVPCMFPEARIDWQLIKVWTKDCVSCSRKQE